MGDASRPPSDGLALLAFATVVIVLGMNFLMVRWSNEDLAPFWGAGLRFAIGAALLFAVVAAREPPLPRGRGLGMAMLYGVLQFGATYAFLYWSLVEVPAGTSGVLFSTVPLMTLLLAVAFGLERLSPRNVSGALLVVAGIAAVFWDQLGVASPWRLGGVLAGTACAAGASIVVKRGPRMDPLGLNAVGMAVGATVLLVGSLVAGEPVRLPATDHAQIALAWLVMSSIVGFVLIVWLLARWSASRVSYTGVLTPLVAVVSGALLAGERLGWSALAGGAILLYGVYVGALSGHRPMPTPAPALPVADQPANDQ